MGSPQTSGFALFVPEAEGVPTAAGPRGLPPGLSRATSRVPADVKFDAVSGDYYPIIYFNDYWNLQKDYYPINESLASLPLRVSFCPLSLWRWQLYAAQSTKSPWNFLGDELYEQSDEEQDSVKVRRRLPGPCWAEEARGPPASRAPCLWPWLTGGPAPRRLWASVSFAVCLAGPSASGHAPPCSCPGLWAPA